MIKKLYDEAKIFIKNNYKSLIIFFIVFVLCTVNLPFYIEKPGGIINVDSRIKIKDSYKKDGSFNLSYVSELNATVPTLLYSLINKDWDIIKKEEVVYDNETVKEANYRDKLLLKSANSNAIMVAYTKAHKQIEIDKENLYVTYIDKMADTNLKIGDKIESVDEIEITKRSQLDEIMYKKSIGENIKFKVKRDNEEISCYGVINEFEGKKLIGIVLTKVSDIKTTPSIELEFKDSESGPSGGLILALSIYNHLVSEDITKGRRIVGTGTIDENGNVGSIGGVEYKIKGAVKEKADIFLVPEGENYEEAKKIIEENNYDLKLISVNTFDEALEKLK